MEPAVEQDKEVEVVQIVVEMVGSTIKQPVLTENHHHTIGVGLTAKTHQQTTNIIIKKTKNKDLRLKIVLGLCV